LAVGQLKGWWNSWD